MMHFRAIVGAIQKCVRDLAEKVTNMQSELQEMKAWQVKTEKQKRGTAPFKVLTIKAKVTAD